MTISVDFTGLYTNPRISPSSSSPSDVHATVPVNALAGPVFVIDNFVRSSPYFFTRATRGGLGTPWNSVVTPVSDIVNFAIMPNNHWFLADLRAGFWRSTDQGATWTLINSGIAPSASRSYGPCGTAIFYDSHSDQLIAGTNNLGAFYRSSDEGDTWIIIPNACAAQTGFQYGYLGALPATAVAVAPSGNLVFAFQVAIGRPVAGVATLLPSVCYSHDGGLTTTLSTFTPPTHLSPGGYNFPTDIRVVIYNQITNEFWLGSGGYGPFRSTDGGASWLPASDGWGFSRNISGMTYDASGNILCATDDGVMKSSLSGGIYTWTLVRHTSEYISGEQFYAMGRDSSDNLYLGNAPTPNPFNPSLELLGSIYRSTDAGATWAPYDGTNPSYTGTDAAGAGNQFAGLCVQAQSDFSQPTVYVSPTCYRILQSPSDGKMYALIDYLADEGVLVNGFLAELFLR